MMNPKGTTILAGKILVILLLILSSILTSCTGLLFFLPDLREFVAAEYKLPKDKKIAILIDDLYSPIPLANAKGYLAEKIRTVLIEEGNFPQKNIIDYKLISDYIEREYETQNKLTPIAEIGKKIGADYVIYVNITEHSLQEEKDNPLVSPYIRAYVKVVKVEGPESKRIWPIEKIGKEIFVRQKTVAELISDVNTEEYYSKLLAALADRIAKLFFDHKEGSIR